MAIRLDPTIVPAKDTRASARFFAEIFGPTVKPGNAYFSQVRINERKLSQAARLVERAAAPGGRT